MVVHLYKIFMDIWNWTSQRFNCNLKLKIDFYKIAHIDSAAFLPIIISSFFAMHVENIKWIQNCYLDIWEWTSQRLHCKDWIQEHFLKLWKLWTGFRNCILCLKLQICSIIWILKCSNFSMKHSKNHSLKSKQQCIVDNSKQLILYQKCTHFSLQDSPWQRDGPA